jgi:hypothetical protein
MFGMSLQDLDQLSDCTGMQEALRLIDHDDLRAGRKNSDVENCENLSD